MLYKTLGLVGAVLSTSIRNIFRFPTYIYLDNLCSSAPEVMLYILLGRVQNLRTNCQDIDDEVNTFIYICAKYFHHTARTIFSQDY